MSSRPLESIAIVFSLGLGTAMSWPISAADKLTETVPQSDSLSAEEECVASQVAWLMAREPMAEGPHGHASGMNYYAERLSHVRNEDELIDFLHGLFSPRNWTIANHAYDLDVLSPLRDALRQGQTFPKLEEMLRQEATPIRRLSDGSRAQSVLDALLIAENPSYIDQWLERALSDDVHKFSNNFPTGGDPYANRTLFRSIWDLPPGKAKQLFAHLMKRIETFENSAPKPETDDPEAEGKKKVPRRKMEFIAALLNYPNLAHLREALEKSPDTRSKIAAMDSYLRKTKIPGRGGYSFGKVLKMASKLREAIKPLLINGEYAELLGSIPNGKGNLATSDADLLLSPGLNELVRTTLGSTSDGHVSFVNPTPESLGVYAPFVPQIQAYARAGWGAQTSGPIAKMFIEAEKGMVSVIGSSHKPGDLLSVQVTVPIFIDHDTKLRALGEYNPIIIRIYRDSVHVIILDPYDEHNSPTGTYWEMPFDLNNSPD